MLCTFNSVSVYANHWIDKLNLGTNFPCLLPGNFSLLSKTKSYILVSVWTPLLTRLTSFTKDQKLLSIRLPKALFSSYTLVSLASSSIILSLFILYSTTTIIFLPLLQPLRTYFYHYKTGSRWYETTVPSFSSLSFTTALLYTIFNHQYHQHRHHQTY